MDDIHHESADWQPVDSHQSNSPISRSESRSRSKTPMDVATRLELDLSPIQRKSPSPPIVDYAADDSFDEFLESHYTRRVYKKQVIEDDELPDPSTLNHPAHKPAEQRAKQPSQLPAKKPAKKLAKSPKSSNKSSANSPSMNKEVESDELPSPSSLFKPSKKTSPIKKAILSDSDDLPEPWMPPTHKPIERTTPRQPTRDSGESTPLRNKSTLSSSASPRSSLSGRQRRETRNFKPVYTGHPAFEEAERTITRNQSSFMQGHDLLQSVLPGFKRLQNNHTVDRAILSVNIASSDSDASDVESPASGFPSEANAEYIGSTTRHFKKQKLAHGVETHLLKSDRQDLVQMLNTASVMLIIQFPRIVDLRELEDVENPWPACEIADGLQDVLLESGRLNDKTEPSIIKWIWNKSTRP